MMTFLADNEFDEVCRRIKRGYISELAERLDSGLDPNLKNRFGWTLLMMAAMEGRRDVIDLLISRGADFRAVNQFGNTAESLAHHGGHKGAAARLAALSSTSI